MPGTSHAGPLPPLSDEERALAERLRRHVFTLAKTERNTDLETPARYIADAFAAHGLKAEFQRFESGGRTVSNIEVSPSGPALVVVGAHYDTVPGSPGADDNASGVAALIEHPAIMTHASLPEDVRANLGIDEGLVRLSVGIENVDDLIAELKHALE